MHPIDLCNKLERNCSQYEKVFSNDVIKLIEAYKNKDKEYNSIFKHFNIEARKWLESNGWRNNWADHNWVNEKFMGPIYDSSGVDVLTAVLLQITNKKVVSAAGIHISLSDADLTEKE